MAEASNRYLKLKSGSDVRGTAIGDGTVLTLEAVERLAAAFALLLAKRNGIPADAVTVAVGRDSRLSGPSLLAAACRGIAGTGAVAYDCGMCTTPSMFMAILEPGFTPTGSIMITASHHPWDKNGMKFFTETGGVGYDDLNAILELAEKISADSIQPNGRIETYPYIRKYRRHLEAFIRDGLGAQGKTPLKGLHAVVDAGNGAGGFYAELLSDLGADTSGSQFLDPDGHFPNHPPNPENEEAMNALSEAVVRAKADLGIIFDADCDRAAIVDPSGKEINRNRLIALISAILLKKHSGATIVTDSVTSTGLAAFIQALGGKHYRFRRGYRNVIDEAVRLNQAGIDCPLAIETSGHAALRENMFLDDGMYLVTYLIVQAMLLKREGRMLSSLIDGLREPLESAEYRVKILSPDFKKAGELAIQAVLNEAAKRRDCHIAPDNREGVRVSFDLDGGENNGWFLLRLSVHDPVMPINVESDIGGGNRTMLRMLYDIVNTMPDLDGSVLLDALGI